uniref:Cyclin D1 n=1 Tax=Callorhinchus milii TaxID=7868 RepID=A0A4W3K989_CALMI
MRRWRSTMMPHSSLWDIQLQASGPLINMLKLVASGTNNSLLCVTKDVKFISNPPSMIAAGSMAAAVHGLHLGNSNSFLSYQPLTDFLSQIIKCDPDCLRACQEQIESLLETSLRQVQHNSIPSETKTVEDELDLSCTPTDVRDVNL